MTIQPDGEDLRKAIRWISEERQRDPERNTAALIEAACVRFDLSPLDAEHLSTYFT